jgi:hypothetical protein
MHHLRYIHMSEFRHRTTWISLIVGLAVAGVGMVLLRDAPDAKAAFVMVCFVLTIELRHFLDHRADRKREKARKVRAQTQS